MLGPVRTFQSQLLRWYAANHRELPWRVTVDMSENAIAPAAIDPYHVLVSELMLQQTQVATVIPYFKRFIGRFPTVGDLADADEQDVLRLWQGLGYYSRARNLKKAAEMIVRAFEGAMPHDVESLLRLPGVGRYTAGAIASLAFEQRAPILDGNVMRVLCRLDCIKSDPRERSTREALWARAEAILPPQQLGNFNSSLMELGATICTPRSPKCLFCPVKDHCEAFSKGIAESIPAPRKAKAMPLLKRSTFCIRHGKRWLLEQRPSTGRWAGMWQFITVETTPLVPATSPGIPVLDAKRIGNVSHALTHRRYEFEVWFATAPSKKLGSAPLTRRWLTFEDISKVPLPRPHVKIQAMLQSLIASP